MTRVLKPLVLGGGSVTAVVLSQESRPQQSAVRAFRLVVFFESCAFAAPKRTEVLC